MKISQRNRDVNSLQLKIGRVSDVLLIISHNFVRLIIQTQFDDSTKEVNPTSPVLFLHWSWFPGPRCSKSG